MIDNRIIMLNIISGYIFSVTLLSNIYMCLINTVALSYAMAKEIVKF